jgi:hypothetical protein
MTLVEQQQNKNKKQPFAVLIQELTNLYKEIKSNTNKLKEMYEKVDKMSEAEGFAESEIYDLTLDMYEKMKNDNDNNNELDEDNNTNKNNNNITYPYFQYFK